jgi:hypothetical protein
MCRLKLIFLKNVSPTKKKVEKQTVQGTNNTLLSVATRIRTPGTLTRWKAGLETGRRIDESVRPIWAPGSRCSTLTRWTPA